MISLFTIGFTKKSAEQFFELLKNNHVKRLIDVRINNTSQLAGFAKGKDLAYFVRQICGIGYDHVVDFAPTKELLDQWHDKAMTWQEYETIYRSLLNKRRIANQYSLDEFDGACFLCSEDTPEQCHRRLLVEYIAELCPGEITIKHLV